MSESHKKSNLNIYNIYDSPIKVSISKENKVT